IGVDSDGLEVVAESLLEPLADRGIEWRSPVQLDFSCLDVRWSVLPGLAVDSFFAFATTFTGFLRAFAARAFSKWTVQMRGPHCKPRRREHCVGRSIGLTLERIVRGADARRAWRSKRQTAPDLVDGSDRCARVIRWSRRRLQRLAARR